MEVVYERCCGLDVHKDKIVACIKSGNKKETKTFGTVTDDLLLLLDWIKSEECQMVAMESTGSYWKPVYNLLEVEEIPAMVVNAQHIKAVPGRKTDVKDAEWIADLLKHGLLRGSYIPSRDQRELKELVRYRRSMISERARELNRLQKVLEGANIKLGSVVSDINGVSARQMLMSMIEGNDDIDKLVLFAKGKMKEKTEDLKRSLKGLMGGHQRMILSKMMEHIKYLDRLIEGLDEEIKERMRPFEEKVVALDAITGVGERSAQTIIAEIGTNMSTFPSASHLASWAGMCPGNNESAGKKKSGKTRKGNNTLRCTLVECAKAAGRSKNTYLSAQYKRLAARRGRNRAAVAVGHSILTIAYYILRDSKSFYDLGSDYFEQKKKQDIARRALKRLEDLGYKVTVEKIGA
jgi:transposase